LGGFWLAFLDGDQRVDEPAKASGPQAFLFVVCLPADRAGLRRPVLAIYRPRLQIGQPAFLV